MGFVVIIESINPMKGLSTVTTNHKEAGERFLAENAKHDDVHVTPSGLQYSILREVDGPKPHATSVVEVHYHGTFIDNKTFDSSYMRAAPAIFPLDGVIEGWAEGVQLMSVGSMYKFYVPSALAYGEAGVPGVIPPDCVLIFEVELLAIKS